MRPLLDIRARASLTQYLLGAPKRAPRGPGSGDGHVLAELLANLDHIPQRGPRARQGTYEERFWNRVQKGPDCWEWAGPRNQFGYGQFSFRGHTIHAQRVAYALAFGAPAQGLCICHHCDNRGCVRPSHLFAGTVGDNLRDMVRKGRHPETVLKSQLRLGVA